MTPDEAANPNKAEFAKSFRKYMRPEWQAVVFYDYVPRKNTVETHAYFTAAGLDLRCDFEFNIEELSWDDGLHFLAMCIDSDVQDEDLLDEIRSAAR